VNREEHPLEQALSDKFQDDGCRRRKVWYSLICFRKEDSSINLLVLHPAMKDNLAYIYFQESNNSRHLDWEGYWYRAFHNCHGRGGIGQQGKRPSIN
jgi:hypothetical protein